MKFKNISHWFQKIKMPISNVTLKQLRTLSAVVETGSISAAADRALLSPPAVHTQLKNLEESVGAELLDRSHPGRMTATPAGRVLIDAASRMDSELNRALRDIDAQRKGKLGQVVLGVVSTGKYFAPALVARLRNLHPRIEVLLRVGNREETITALNEGTVHLAIMGRPPRVPEVVAETIGNHPHSIVAKPGHRLTKLDEVSEADLLTQTFICREEGSGTRILSDRFLDRIGNGQIYDRVIMDSNETIKQAVMAGLGLAMISIHTVEEELRSGRLVVLKTAGLPIIRQWYLLYPSAHPLSPAASTIYATVSEMQGDFLPSL